MRNSLLAHKTESYENLIKSRDIPIFLEVEPFLVPAEILVEHVINMWEYGTMGRCGIRAF